LVAFAFAGASTFAAGAAGAGAGFGAISSCVTHEESANIIAAAAVVLVSENRFFIAASVDKTLVLQSAKT
jgi:hypothetical protein